MRPFCWLLIALLGGCYVPTKKLSVRLELPPELASGAKDLQVLPRIAEARRELGRAVIALELKREAGQVQLLLPGACPVRLDTRKQPPNSAILPRPWFDVGPTERVVGLGQKFELHAEPGCHEAELARTSFTVESGAALTDVNISADGRHFSARTDSAPPASVGPGIVPVSAREQRERRTQLSFRVELADGTHLERSLFVSAVVRSSGLPNVGLAHPVLLSGAGWNLLEKPANSTTFVRSAGTLSELLPDVAGLYRLRDADDRELSIRSGRYDQTPLDCGRADCHAELVRATRASPMTQVLASDLGGCHELTDPECAIGCHATGEPAARDGGFSHVMAELGLAKLPADYDELPRALRRLGGVGCLACHGPTKIPEPQARFGLLRNDVCAVCHDAPPRYGHVMALEASRMGHADALAETRAQPCARCHTSWGALGRPSPPAQAEGGGITCVTCHDVHPHGAVAQDDAERSHAGLLRSFPLPPSLPSPPASFRGISSSCSSCHAPTTELGRPEASAAAIVAGQGGLDPATGAALALPGPHATAERGCLSCHDAGPDELVLGKNHGFRASEQACRRCHDASQPRDPAIAVRARQLLERLEPGQANAPRHAAPQPLPANPRRARALRDVLLVLEDPAADAHHPKYAKALLDAAETGASP